MSQQHARKNFDTEAALWDASSFKVKLAQDISRAMLREISLPEGKAIMDFGCGTGLVTLELAPFKGTITGVDNSPGMLEVLQQKIAAQGFANIKTQCVDFEKGEKPAGRFDLIVSSMAVHHVPDTAGLLRMWFDLLLPGGQIAFSDLDSEDGSFHGDNTGVFHQGFDREELRALLLKTGFKHIRATTATVVSKEVEGGMRDFSIFLMAAAKEK